MKLFVVLAVVACSYAAKLDNTYLPPSNSQTSGGSGSFLETPLASPADYQGQGQADFARNGFSKVGNGFAQNVNGFSQSENDFAQNGPAFNNFDQRPERAQASFERNAAILRQDNQNDGETYSYAYETENGIYAEENGIATNGVEAQGGYSYTGDDGKVYSIRYTADQNGFVPQGDHLPTPPPIPEEILKALEQNSRDEAAGIFDDGTYNEGKYGNNEEQYISNRYNGNFNNGNSQYESDDDSVVTNSAAFRSGNGFNGAQNRGVFNNQATTQAYLPPTQGGFNSRSNQGFNSNQATSQAYLPPNQGRFNSRSNQRSNAKQATNQAYLPPNQGRFNSQSNQGSNANQATNQAYLPPNQGFNSRANQGSFNNGANGSLNNGATNKAYLPPVAGQRNSGFGSRTRQPSFSATSGYRY